MNLRETYNRIAEDWHKDHKADDWWIEGTNTFIGQLSKGARVLDVGCGGGTKTKYLTERGLSVLGIDFAENLLAIAKREVPNAAFSTLDFRDLSSLPELFDGIFAQASLLHIKKHDVPEVLRGFVEKLKPGGLLYVAVKQTKEVGSEEETKIEDDYGYPYERFFSYFTLPELEKYFRDLGLTIPYSSVTSPNDGKTYWIQIIGKKPLD